MLELLDRLESQGLQIEHLDLGGGLGIRYSGKTRRLRGIMSMRYAAMIGSAQAAHSDRTRAGAGGKCGFAAYARRVSEA